MKAKKSNTKKLNNAVAPRKPLTLYPLSFDEAVTDILKVKPEPKGKAAKRKRVK